MKGILLADRGFSNKEVRSRINSNKKNLFNYDKAYCRLISPYHYKSKKSLNDKEKKIYKKRWAIEPIFDQLKDIYHEFEFEFEFKLNLTGNYTKKLKKAKFYMSTTLDNLKV